MNPKNPNKETFWSKYKSQLITMIISGLVLFSYEFISDIIEEGSNKKFDDRVMVVFMSEDADDHTREIVNQEIQETMKSPLIWFEVLGSDILEDFVSDKEIEVHDKIKKDLIESDSLDNSFVEQLGKAAGIRDEDVAKFFGSMLKEYIEDNRGDIRRVEVSF